MSKNDPKWILQGGKRSYQREYHVPPCEGLQLLMVTPPSPDLHHHSEMANRTMQRSRERVGIKLGK